MYANSYIDLSKNGPNFQKVGKMFANLHRSLSLMDLNWVEWSNFLKILLQRFGEKDLCKVFWALGFTKKLFVRSRGPRTSLYSETPLNSQKSFFIKGVLYYNLDDFKKSMIL